MNTKKPFFPIFIILYCLGTLYSSPMQGQQRDTQKEYNVDSTLYAYYMRCKAEVSSPITVQMSDTLPYGRRKRRPTHAGRGIMQ